MDEETETHGSPHPVNGHAALGGLVPAGTVPSQRCTATNRAGEPCGRWAIVGGLVCPTHGGSAPQVRAAAMQRILDQAPAAIAALVRNIQPDAPAAVQVRAADSLLDRAGLKSADVLVQVTEELERPDLDQAIERMLASRFPGALDVEPVDEA